MRICPAPRFQPVRFATPRVDAFDSSSPSLKRWATPAMAPADSVTDRLQAGTPKVLETQPTSR